MRTRPFALLGGDLAEIERAIEPVARAALSLAVRDADAELAEGPALVRCVEPHGHQRAAGDRRAHQVERVGAAAKASKLERLVHDEAVLAGVDAQLEFADTSSFGNDRVHACFPCCWRAVPGQRCRSG